MRRLLFAILLSAVMYSNAAVPSFAKDKTPSPSTSIAIDASVEKIKDALAQVAAQGGLLIESDSKYQMTLSQVVKPGLALAFSYGTGASAQQLMHFQFVEKDGAVTVSGVAETVVSSQNGQRHIPMDSNKDKAQIQRILMYLKVGAESPN